MFQGNFMKSSSWISPMGSNLLTSVLISSRRKNLLNFSRKFLALKIEGRRRKGQQRMRWLDGITDSMDMSSEQAPGAGDGQGILACCTPWDHKESDTTEGLNWTELNWFFTVSSSLPSAVIQIFLLFFGEIESICLVPPFVGRTSSATGTMLTH